MRILTLGAGALLAALTAAGCTSSSNEPADDAGSFPDEGVLPFEDAGAPDAAAGPGDADDGSPTADGGRILDASEDATLPVSAPDAGDDASARDAGGTSAHDAAAGDGGADGGHASDAGALDAADGESAAPDASDGSASALDATLGVDDASGGGASWGEAGLGPEDASEISDANDYDGGGILYDAGDAAPACVASGVSLSFLGNTAAFVSGGASVALQEGSVPGGATVSIITQTWPQGAVLPGSAHVLYATDAAFTTQVDAIMTFDKQVGNNDQWYVVIPAQTSGTTVYWYVRADGCDCSTVDYDNPGPFQNFTYTEE